jgi:hypothetical protein
LSLKQDPGHRHARLFRWVEHGVLPWPVVASLDPALNILFIDRATYEQATATTKGRLKRCHQALRAE